MELARDKTLYYEMLQIVEDLPFYGTLDVVHDWSCHFVHPWNITEGYVLLRKRVEIRPEVFVRNTDVSEMKRRM